VQLNALANPLPLKMALHPFSPIQIRQRQRFVRALAEPIN
jgi:hypothetical protein